jgi:hypothetical protein
MSYHLATALGAYPLGNVENDDVRHLQSVLKKNGYYSGPVDGLAGPKTFAGQVKLAREALRQLSLIGSKVKAWEVANDVTSTIIWPFAETYAGSIGDSLKEFANKRGPQLVTAAETSGDETKLALVQRSTKNLIQFAQQEAAASAFIVPPLMKEWWSVVVVPTGKGVVDLVKKTGDTVVMASDALNKVSKALNDPIGNPFTFLLVVAAAGGGIYLWARS